MNTLLSTLKLLALAATLFAASNASACDPEDDVCDFKPRKPLGLFCEPDDPTCG